MSYHYITIDDTYTVSLSRKQLNDAILKLNEQYPNSTSDYDEVRFDVYVFDEIEISNTYAYDDIYDEGYDAGYEDGKSEHEGFSDQKYPYDTEKFADLQSRFLEICKTSDLNKIESAIKIFEQY